MEHLFISILLLLALILFALEVLRPDIISMMVMLTLILTGTVTISEGFSGFSNPAVITVIAMFILSAGLERTGVADYLGNVMLKAAGTNHISLTISVMFTVGVMSAFMNNIGATVILITPIFAICKKINYPPTKLLIPLSFGSLMGGLTTLIGTPPNLLVSMALEEHGFEGFKMFDFMPTGLAIMFAGILYMSLVGRHLIPERKTSNDLTASYNLEDYVTEVSIPKNSSLIGTSIADASFFTSTGIIILRIKRMLDEHELEFVPERNTILKEGDRLLIEGDLEKLFQVIQSNALIIHIKTKISDKTLTGKNVKMAEVVISPRSSIIGQSIRQANFKRRYGVLALALRKRERVSHGNYYDQPLQVGDVILIQGSPEVLQEMARKNNFLIVNNLEPKLRDFKKAPFALASMAFAITLAATGILHISVAGMLGVLLMVLSGSVKLDDIYRDVEWRVVFLIACMMPLGIAMDDEHTGTAQWLANHLVNFAGDFGPYIVLIGILICVTLITEIMSNAAAAVLLAPIGISIAISMGLEPYPFLMTIAIGASTTFLTPIGHQANVLVYSVGGYRFTDFARTGVWLNIIIAIITVILVPVIWPFTPLNP